MIAHEIVVKYIAKYMNPERPFYFMCTKTLPGYTSALEFRNVFLPVLQEPLPVSSINGL
jgi:hypothetical protein